MNVRTPHLRAFARFLPLLMLGLAAPVLPRRACAATPVSTAAGPQRPNSLPHNPENGNLPDTPTSATGAANVDGSPAATAGALGLQMFSLTQGGVVNGGWPYYTDDTVFSSPALVDVNGDGVPDVVIGGDSAPGGPIPWRGGRLRAISGHGGTMWQDPVHA